MELFPAGFEIAGKLTQVSINRDGPIE